MTIIKQKSLPPNANAQLPDFQNFGICARILLFCNTGLLFFVLILSKNKSDFLPLLFELSIWVQPISLFSLAFAAGMQPVLRRYAYIQAVAVLFALILGITLSWQQWIAQLFAFELSAWQRWQATGVSLALAASCLTWLNLRARAFSPALAEARLQALQARIRPHFLFNSLNAILGLIHHEPHKAERALEDLADLFRVFMADNRQLSTLQRELDLCWQYVEIERLRLGDRLIMEWHTDKMPANARIPPLLLQPLLENAIYHGIEPQLQAGKIELNIYHNQQQVHIVLRNPYHLDSVSQHSGNKMAMDNIRERLALHFDAEASLDIKIQPPIYQTHIILPYLPVESNHHV